MASNNTLLPTPRDSISPHVPWEYFERLLWLPDTSRSMGIHIMAGKGSGKSRLMGRVIAWLDFIRGIPQVIFDPHGPTIDNFLDKVARARPELQARLLPRVLYIDMSGHSGFVVPFPLYYRFGDESLYEVSQRYLDVVRKIDPFLQTASVEGWNALWRTGTYAGMILAALGYQISEAEGLLLHPDRWDNQFDEALSRYPEIQPAVEYLRELGHAKDNFRQRRTESFFNKIALFSLDPSMRAMFGGSQPGVDWRQVIDRRYTVLLDFRHEHDLERRRFKMVWAFNYFLDFVKQRGAGRHAPISLIIDELTSLFSLQALTSGLFGAELDELINVIARNYGVWLTIAHQELFQITPGIMKSLMTMGTQILGVTSDPAAAMYLSQLYHRYDPYLVKRYEPVYGSFDGWPIVLDQRPIEFTIEEQALLNSYRFTEQGRFQFLVRPAAGEGDATGGLRRLSIAHVDQGKYPEEPKITELRHRLMSSHGLLIPDVLSDVEKRLGPPREEQRTPPGSRQSRRRTEDPIPFWQ